MRGSLLLLSLLIGASGAPALAGDLAGDWQGKVKVQGREYRLVLHLEDPSAGKSKCSLFNLDEPPSEARRCVKVSVKGQDLFFETETGGAFNGVLSADGQQLSGMLLNLGSPSELILTRSTPETAWVLDASDHAVRFVTTSDNVKLEVLDYGGQGSPIILIPGLGAGGHVFDSFAPRLRERHRVYAISRRGYGGSDRPEPGDVNYSAARLGLDVLEVMAALNIEQPILAGWSIGGQELSVVGSGYPEKIAALIYLDAGYAYSYYAPGNMIGGHSPGPNLRINLNELRSRLDALIGPLTTVAQAEFIIDELLEKFVPELQSDLLATKTAMQRYTPWPDPTGSVQPPTARKLIDIAILNGVQRHPRIKAPTLAIYAIGAPPPPTASLSQLADAKVGAEYQEELIRRFEAGNPTAKVVRLQNAQHAVFRSNPDQVIAEMETFLSGLQ